MTFSLTSLRHLTIFVVIFSLLFLVIPANGSLNGDEEMYFKFSSDYILGGSEFNSAFYTGNKMSNHRFLYNYISGGLVNIVGYENTQIIGRLIVIFLFSTSLVKLFKSQGVSVYEAAIVLALFLLFRQTYYSGLQLFKGFLASDLAFSFGLLSISFAFQSRYALAVGALILSTYFHFLIGGYLFLFFIFFLIIGARNNSLLVKYLSFYILGIVPLILLLFESNSILPSEFLAHDSNFVYSYIRHPHHLLPFSTNEMFISNWLPGIIISQILFFLIIYIHYKKIFPSYNKLSLYLIIGNVYLLLALFVSYFDDSYILAKFYLFRPAALVLFLTILFFTKIVWIKFGINRILKSWYMPWLFSFLVFVLSSCFYLLGKRFTFQEHKEKNELIQFVLRETPLNSVFLFEKQMIDFERLTGRSSFFMNKIIPTSETGIIEWYNRRLLYQNVFNCKGLSDTKNINFLVYKSSGLNCILGRRLFQNSEYIVTSLD